MIIQQLSRRLDAGLARHGKRRGQVGLTTALAIVGAMVLAGCEAHPYPSPAPDESAPPPAPPSQLMGAPQTGTPPPVADTPPSPYSAPATPPQGGEIGQRDSYGARPPCPPDPSFRGPNAPSVIVCNAPIPNPPEREPHAWRGEWAHGRHPHHHHRHWMASEYGAPYPAHHRISRRFGEGVAPAYGRVLRHHHHRMGGALAHPHVAPTVRPHVRSQPHVSAAKPAPAVSPIAPVPVPAPGLHGHHHRVHIAPAASSPAAAATTNTVTSSEADRYGALQTALTGEVGRDATLTSPSHFAPNKTSDVSLTLPAGFAQAFRSDAAAQKLSDATASANLTAALSGDGFTVAPQEPQSQPIADGQPIVFHWKVTPQANARGPLQADISADLLGQGHSLPLGSIKSLAGVSRLSGRVIGVGLLVLIALVLLGWAARRSRPAPKGATRPRANHMSMS